MDEPRAVPDLMLTDDRYLGWLPEERLIEFHVEHDLTISGLRPEQILLMAAWVKRWQLRHLDAP
jgi:hypothetical protein